MIETLLKNKETNQPLWIDLKNPTPAEMDAIAEQYKLHPELVHDCLGPFHLPKLEIHNGITFIVIRSYDEKAIDDDDDSIQEMTNKIAFFLGNRFLISFHRHEHKFMNDIVKEYLQKNDHELFLQQLMLELLQSAVQTYQKPLEQLENICEQFESAILVSGSALKWEEIFRTKSRLMVIKRMLWHTQNTVQKFVPSCNAHLPLYQDLKEEIESLIFLTDTLTDDLSSLLNIQISLASHKTNEVMRILTVFSVFFMPLTFIVGVYGMNFDNMPELRHPLGYFILLGSMLILTITFYFWFKKKKWL